MKDKDFFPQEGESVFLLHLEDKAQCWYQEVYYSHSLRHFFCSSIGSSSRDMDPQYFFKSGLLIFTCRFFKAIRIFSRDVPFFIVVTIFLIFDLQIY